MLTCPYCQTENLSTATQCVTCGSSLGSDVLPNGTLLFGNTLEIKSVLGRGGFGIVYKAFHLEKQRFVAIKELFPEGLASRGYNKQVSPSSQSEMQAAIDRTNREAQMLRKLKHPSATRLFAYWEENSTAYMALELLEGETLEKRIQNGQLLTAEEAKNALLTILEVLEELHGHGFLHRDIKPANIMFTPSKVELIDFGSLTEFRKGERTKVSSRIATPEYAPLEQFGSEVTLSPATDLYALAATFCEAMTGSRVPSALDRANGASLEPNILAVQRVSRELGDVFEKALEIRMELRFGNAEKMINSLLKLGDMNSLPTAKVIKSRIPTRNKTLTQQFSDHIGMGLVLIMAVISLAVVEYERFTAPIPQQNPVVVGPSQTASNQPVVSSTNAQPNFPIASNSNPSTQNPLTSSQLSSQKIVRPATPARVIVQPKPVAMPQFSSIEKYHKNKPLFFENPQLLQHQGYINQKTIKYPKVIGKYEINIYDYQLSHDGNYLIIKEDFCITRSKICESYLRFENILLKKTEKIVKWTNLKSDKSLDSWDNYVHFRFANNAFFVASGTGLFQIFTVKGVKLHEFIMEDYLEHMSISDDERFIFLSKIQGENEYSRKRWERGIFIFKVDKFKPVGFMNLNYYDYYYMINAPADKIGIIVSKNNEFSYNEYNLFDGKLLTQTFIDYLNSDLSISVFRQSNNAILILQNRKNNRLESLVGVRRLKEGKLEGIWQINLNQYNNYVEYINKENIIVFSRGNAQNAKIVNFLNGDSYDKKIKNENNISYKRSNKQKNLHYFLNSDNEYNYIQVVKSNLLQ
jgi:serine/threonine protein kinase